jgi:hypothetical protein
MCSETKTFFIIKPRRAFGEICEEVARFALRIFVAGLVKRFGLRKLGRALFVKNGFPNLKWPLPFPR